VLVSILCACGLCVRMFVCACLWEGGWVIEYKPSFGKQSLITFHTPLIRWRGVPGFVCDCGLAHLTGATRSRRTSCGPSLAAKDPSITWGMSSFRHRSRTLTA
jgi:hypothetical protein